jgi:glycosyltransferase involved in cell wall biosynthesis
MSLANVHLAVFLSRATPLGAWEQGGIFEREAALYRSLAARLASLRIVTSGGEEELSFQERLAPAEIVYNRWRLPPNVYSIAAPFLHRGRLRDVTIVRSHQLDGAWAAAIASRAYAKPLIVRAGHLWAEFYERERGRGAKARLARSLQAFALRQATLVTLASEDMSRCVADEYGRSPDSLRVVPNHVNTSLFRPRLEVEPIPGRVCYVGRLHARKNLRLLFEALTRVAGASLDVIGSGEEREALAAFARERRLDVRFLGTLRHARLPDEIARAQVFVLPSRFEGQPKALLEAMACGVAVVGTDVEGIRNVVRHGETGLLCPATAEGLAAAIGRLLADGGLRDRLGRAAREAVERTFSLDRVVEQELALLTAVAPRGVAAWHPTIS